MSDFASDFGIDDRGDKNGQRYPLNEREEYLARAAGVNTAILDANQRAQIIAALAWDNVLIEDTKFQGGVINNFSGPGALRDALHHTPEEIRDEKLEEQLEKASTDEKIIFRRNVSAMLFNNIDRNDDERDQAIDELKANPFKKSSKTDMMLLALSADSGKSVHSVKKALNARMSLEAVDTHIDPMNIHHEEVGHKRAESRHLGDGLDEFMKKKPKS